MIYILVFSDYWGYIEGGINAFNYDFTLSLGNRVRNSDYKIIAITYVDPPHSLVQNANQSNVEVFSLAKKEPNLSLQTDLNAIKDLVNSLKFIEYIYFVGHDVITGELVNYLASQIGEIANSIVFHHMDYEAYYSIKGESTMKEVDKKISYQKEVLSAANYVIGVGPKLEESANAKTAGQVFRVIPGMAIIEPWKSLKKLTGITFGRYDVRTDRLKQMGLAVKAFAEFVKENYYLAASDATLKVIGLGKDEERDKITEIYEDAIKQYVNVVALPYKSDREKLHKELAQSNLCLMLSVHEGFGLVGFEAIAAGVPLILSENSGLFEFLLEQFPRTVIEKLGIYPVLILGSNTGDWNDRDVEVVKTAIKTIRENQETYRMGISKLRDIFLKDFTWDHTAASFLKILDSIFVNRIPVPVAITLNNRSADMSVNDGIYLQAADTVEKHAELWRWNQRTFKHRHPGSYQDFDLVGLSLGRSWWKRYPLQDWILRDWLHEQIGTYCLVPITKQRFNELVEGKIIETDLKPTDIILQKNIDSHPFWYLANFMKAKINKGIKSEVSQYASNVMIHHMAVRATGSPHFSTFNNKDIHVVAFVEAKSIKKTVETLRFRKAHPHTKDTELEKVYTATWSKSQLQLVIQKTGQFLEDNREAVLSYKQKGMTCFVQPPNY